MNSYQARLVVFIFAFTIVGIALFSYFALTGRGEILQRESSERSFLGSLFLGRSPHEPIEPRTRNLATFPEVESTWKSRFAAYEDAPSGSFLAYYFDTEQGPPTNMKPRIVDSIDINFGWAYDPVANRNEDFTSAPGAIASENFGAYWRGTVILEKEEEMELIVDTSWSTVRVIIDGRIVHSGASNTSGGGVAINLPAGAHTIEVEYANDWHTTGLSVVLRPKIDREAMVEREIEILNESRGLWRVSVYESESIDNRITLSVTPGTYEPVILQLDSYSGVKWDMSGIPKGLVQAVLVSSHSGAAEPINVPEGTEVIYRTGGGGNGSYDEVSEYGNVSQYGAASLVLPGG